MFKGGGCFKTYAAILNWLSMAVFLYENCPWPHLRLYVPLETAFIPSKINADITFGFLILIWGISKRSPQLASYCWYLSLLLHWHYSSDFPPAKLCFPWSLIHVSKSIPQLTFCVQISEFHSLLGPEFSKFTEFIIGSNNIISSIIGSNNKDNKHVNNQIK